MIQKQKGYYLGLRYKIPLFTDTRNELENVNGGFFIYKISTKGERMKATGIVRRIDDLGRIVIPKEIRRTLRIRESDPLEIFTDREGEIILKKYSSIGEMTGFAKQYADSLAQVSGKVAVIADRDRYIAVSGGMKTLLNKHVSKDVERKMENREQVLAKKNDKSFVMLAEDESDVEMQVMAPIISEGDVVGAVFLLASDESIGETEKKLVLSAASFLGKQMEL